MGKSIQKQNDELDEVLGGGNYLKSDDIVGKSFEILGFEMVDVAGYDTKAANVKIVLDGKETSWSTFSEVIIEQLGKLKAKKLFPCRLTLKEVDSTKRKGKSYLRLVVAK